MTANVEAQRHAHRMLNQIGSGQVEAVVKLLEITLHSDDEALTEEDGPAVAASRECFRLNPEGGVPSSGWSPNPAAPWTGSGTTRARFEGPRRLRAPNYRVLFDETGDAITVHRMRDRRKRTGEPEASRFTQHAGTPAPSLPLATLASQPRPLPEPPRHSYRRARSGSTRDARTAGM